MIRGFLHASREEPRQATHPARKARMYTQTAIKGRDHGCGPALELGSRKQGMNGVGRVWVRACPRKTGVCRLPGAASAPPNRDEDKGMRGAGLPVLAKTIASLAWNLRGNEPVESGCREV